MTQNENSLFPVAHSCWINDITCLLFSSVYFTSVILYYHISSEQIGPRKHSNNGMFAQKHVFLFLKSFTLNFVLYCCWLGFHVCIYRTQSHILLNLLLLYTLLVMDIPVGVHVHLVGFAQKLTHFVIYLGWMTLQSIK